MWPSGKSSSRSIQNPAVSRKTSMCSGTTQLFLTFLPSAVRQLESRTCCLDPTIPSAYAPGVLGVAGSSDVHSPCSAFESSFLLPPQRLEAKFGM